MTGAWPGAGGLPPWPGAVKQAGGGGPAGQGEPARGAAIGAAIGLAGLAILDQVEDENLGSWPIQVKDKMKETGQEALDRGKQVARRRPAPPTQPSRAPRSTARSWPRAPPRTPKTSAPRPAGAPGHSRRLGRWHGRGASGATARPCRHPLTWSLAPSIINYQFGACEIGRPLRAEGATRATWTSADPPIWVVGGRCLVMILFSVVASVVGTVLLNLLLR